MQIEVSCKELKLDSEVLFIQYGCDRKTKTMKSR